jgi:protein-tyrosine phosphatase
MTTIATLYSIKGPWKGELAIVPRPRGNDWLEDDLRALRKSGLDVIVSLLTPGEERELGLELEATLAASVGLRFFQFPISDYGVPSLQSASVLIESLDAELTRGKNVGIHCRQGIGRSTVISSSLLVRGGIDPVEALQRVAAARGRPVPDTPEQSEWVRSFARHLSTATVHP